MSAQDWTILIGVLTNSALAAWGAFTLWSDRRQKAQYEQRRVELEIERQKSEDAHRHKMEELQMVAIRQGGAAAKEAKKAQEAALASRKEVTQKINESISERREQVKKIETKIDKNSEVNEAALEAANGTNEKIKSLGLEIAGQKAPLSVDTVNIKADHVEVTPANKPTP